MDPTLLLSAAGNMMPTPKDFLNLGSTLYMNYRSQRFSKKMYAQQYDDAVRFWNMQNEYNHPKAQMARFADAGLNPNLVYGRGESGNAGTIPVPDVVPAQFREPRFEGGSDAMMANLLGQADLRIKNAQANNLEVQNEVIRLDAVLRALQSERMGFDLGIDHQFAADFKRESLRNLKTQTDISINRDAREAAMNSSSIQEAAERMLTMQQERTMIPFRKGHMSADTARINEQIRVLIKDGTLKDLDIELRRLGIKPDSPLWATVVGRALSNPDSFVSRVGSGVSSLLSKLFSH